MKFLMKEKIVMQVKSRNWKILWKDWKKTKGSWKSNTKKGIRYSFFSLFSLNFKIFFCLYMIGLVHRLVEIEVEFILEDSLEVIKYTCFRPKITITDKTWPSYWLYSLLTVNYNFKWNIVLLKVILFLRYLLLATS